MFFYEGQSCPVCGQYFGESDDVVACPQCGAPHHRDCWKKEGHCHFAADHGTDRQWAKPESETPNTSVAHDRPHHKCPNCGKDNPEFAEFCSFCGREIDHPDWTSEPPHPPRVNQYTPPPRGDFGAFRAPFQDPFGGIPRTEEIEGVSVETIAEVLGPQSAYYLPRFYKMSRSGKKISWNWSAFLLSYNWLLYRKNLLLGWLCFVFMEVLGVFYLKAAEPLEKLLSASPIPALTGDSYLLLWILWLSFGVMLAVHVLLGMFGNWLYMQNVLKKARKLQEDPDLQYNQSFLNTGGTSFAMAILPNLCVAFIQYVMILFTM